MLRIIAFTIALFFGIFTASLFNSADAVLPCGDSNFHQHSVNNVSGKSKEGWFRSSSFNLNRNYTEDEAKALVGKKVRNVTPLNAKCPKDAGDCLNLKIGELGEVVGVLPSIKNTFLIEIQWNERIEDGFQHSGRFVTRAGKEVSFEILD